MAASSMRRQGSGLESSRRSLVGRIQQRKSCSGILIAGGLAPSGETITAYISRWPHTSHQPLIPLTNQNEDDPGVPPATAEAYMTACKTGVPPQGLGMADATQTMDMDLASALTTANHTATTGFPCNSDWTQGERGECPHTNHLYPTRGRLLIGLKNWLPEPGRSIATNGGSRHTNKNKRLREQDMPLAAWAGHPNCVRDAGAKPNNSAPLSVPPRPRQTKAHSNQKFQPLQCHVESLVNMMANNDIGDGNKPNHAPHAHAYVLSFHSQKTTPTHQKICCTNHNSRSPYAKPAQLHQRNTTSTTSELLGASTPLINNYGHSENSVTPCKRQVTRKNKPDHRSHRIPKLDYHRDKRASSASHNPQPPHPDLTKPITIYRGKTECCMLNTILAEHVEQRRTQPQFKQDNIESFVWLSRSLGKHSGHSSTRSSVRSTAPLTITEAVLQLNTACGSPDLVGIGEGDSICTLIDRPTMTGSKPVITSSGEECTSFTLALKCSFLDLGTAVRRITHTHALMDVLTPAGEGVVAGTGAPSISHLGSGGNPNANHCLRCTIHGSQAALATLGLTDAPLHISSQGIFNAAAAAAIGGAAGPRPNMSPPSPLASHDSGLPQEPNTSSAVANPPSPPTSACPTPSNGEGEAVAGESSAHKRQRTAESPPPPGSANITMDVDADSAVADWLTKLVHASSADNISSLCVHTAAGPNGFSICIDGNNTDFAETLLRRSKSGLIPPIEVGIEFGREKVSVRLSPPSVTNHHRRYAIVVTGVSAANRTSPQAAQFVIKQLADLAGDGVKRIHDLVAQWAPVADKDDLAALSVALSYFGANTKDILRLYSVVLGSNVSLKQAESDATISLSVMTDGHGHAFSLMPSGYTTISSSVLVYCNTALTVALLTLGAQYRLTHNDGSTPALRAYMKQGHLAVSIWAGLNNSDTMPDLSYSEASARVSAQLFISLANGSSVAETAEAMAKLGDGPVPAAIIEQAVHSMATLLSAAPQALSDTTPPPEPVSAARVGPSSRTNSLTNRTASGNSRGRASDGTEATSRSNPGRGEGNRGASSRGGGSYNHGRSHPPTGGRTSGRESGRGRGRGSGSQF